MELSRMLVVLALAGLLTTGCQESNTLSGSVTYNGEPVENGAISFRPVEGQGRGFGVEIVDGRYGLPESHPGKKRVAIIGVKEIDFGESREENLRKYTEAKAAGKDWAGHLSEPADYIPEDAEGNGQIVEIEAGTQVLNFDLKGPPRS